MSWRFNAWGGKSVHQLDEGLARRILNSLELECIGSFLANEGGAIHVDGEGTLITTESVLLNSNRNPGIGKGEIERIFSRLLGIEKTIWLPGDPDHVTGDMTDGHVDGVCAFSRPGHLLVDATLDGHSTYGRVVREILTKTVVILLRSGGASRVGPVKEADGLVDLLKEVHAGHAVAAGHVAALVLLGALVAVVAQGPDGPLAIKAGATLLATGGFEDCLVAAGEGVQWGDGDIDFVAEHPQVAGAQATIGIGFKAQAGQGHDVAL